MLRLLIDRDLNRNILRELRRRIPNLDAVAVEDIGLDAATDLELLELAATEGRIIVTPSPRREPERYGNWLMPGQKTQPTIKTRS